MSGHLGWPKLRVRQDRENVRSGFLRTQSRWLRSSSRCIFSHRLSSEAIWRTVAAGVDGDRYADEGARMM